MFQKLKGQFTREKLMLFAKALAVIVFILVFFYQDLVILFADAVNNEATSYILVVPFLIGYVIYRKRKILRVVSFKEEQFQFARTSYLSQVIGILFVLLAISVYWVGSYAFAPLEYHMIALPITTIGLMLILFNYQALRHLAFPIAFLFFLVPPSSKIFYSIGANLSVQSSRASSTIVNTIGIPSTIINEFANPTIVITRPNLQPTYFTVDIAFSGICSLLGFTIIAIFLAYIIRDRPWKKLLILLVGLPIIYSLNVVRISSTLIIGYLYGETLALQIFHLIGGWVLIFIGTMLLLLISEKLFKTRIFSTSEDVCPKCNSLAKSDKVFCFKCGRIIKSFPISLHRVDIAKIFAVILTAVILVSLQAPVFALTQTNPIISTSSKSGEQFSTEILPEIQGYNLIFNSRDNKFEATANLDMALVYLYKPTNPTEKEIWVTMEIGTTFSRLHRWETSLITYPVEHGQPPQATQIALEDEDLLQNPRIIGRFFVFNYTNTHITQAVLYWFDSAAFTVNSTAQEKRLKISIITYPENLNELSNIKNKMMATAIQIVDYWQPIKTWSEATFILSANSSTLIGIICAALAAAVIMTFLEKRKTVHNSAKTYNKLSDSSKLLIDVIRQTEKTSLPTLNNIAINREKETGKNINKIELIGELLELEKIGVINNTITSIRDEPIQTWETHTLFKTKSIRLNLKKNLALRNSEYKKDAWENPHV
jgi:exosortase